MRPSSSGSPHRAPCAAAVGTAAVVFAFLAIAAIPYRQEYQPDDDALPTFVDALMLAPSSSWHDWFARGYSDFWNAYPEWPYQDNGFCRPAFTLMLYLAHFALGMHWSWYLFINYVAIASLAAVIFQLSRVALGLESSPSFFATFLVLQAPPIATSDAVASLPFASEALAAALVVGAFLALLARRDIICFVLLMVAVFTKETAIWAPGAAAATILLRDWNAKPARPDLLKAIGMLLPLALWLAFRFAFFAGIGGTYATEDYVGIPHALQQAASKLLHLAGLLVNQGTYIGYFTPDRYPAAERFVRIMAYAVLAVPFMSWAARNLWGISLATLKRANFTPAHLATLWAAASVVFYLALPLDRPRYEVAAVAFIWPALLAEVLRMKSRIMVSGLGVCLFLSLLNTQWLAGSTVEPRFRGRLIQDGRDQAVMGRALQALPSDITQVYVLPYAGLPFVSPDLIAAFYGVSGEIARIADMDDTRCATPGKILVRYEYAVTDGVVTFSGSLPDCATFFLQGHRLGADRIENGELRRNASISYDLAAANVSVRGEQMNLGPKLLVRIRPHGPARFIIEHAKPGVLDWFDVFPGR